MRRARRKDIKHHLPEEEIDEMLREAEDDARLRRIGFVKNALRKQVVGQVEPPLAKRSVQG